MRLISFPDTTSTSDKGATSQNGATVHPSLRTSKPRPYACTTCGRSFARLEHLKRHVRSHTKEKPFECSQCTRCFTRRDVLLRHEQKLHAAKPQSSQSREDRKESLKGPTVSGGKRARKNSVATIGKGRPSASMGASSGLPRANTSSHIDLSTLGPVDVTNANKFSTNRMDAIRLDRCHHQSARMPGIPDEMGFDCRGMLTAMGHHVNSGGLPITGTPALESMDVSNSMRAAPAVADFGGFDLGQLMSPGTPINLAQLHSGGSVSTIPQMPPSRSSQPCIEEHNFSERTRSCSTRNAAFAIENAIDEPSPLKISSGNSLGDFNETESSAITALQSSLPWSQREIRPRPPLAARTCHTNVLGCGLSNPEAPTRTVSPSSILDPTLTADYYLHQIVMRCENMGQPAQ